MDLSLPLAAALNGKKTVAFIDSSGQQQEIFRGKDMIQNNTLYLVNLHRISHTYSNYSSRNRPVQ